MRNCSVHLCMMKETKKLTPLDMDLSSYSLKEALLIKVFS